MYFALEQVAPGQDIGFYLKAEYEEALRIHNANTL